MSTKAIVQSQDGNPVKLRKDPSTKNAYLAKVPSGTEVDVLASAQGWATVEWNGKHGYMMSQFLVMQGEDTDEKTEETTQTHTIDELYDLLLPIYHLFFAGDSEVDGDLGCGDSEDDIDSEEANG